MDTDIYSRLSPFSSLEAAMGRIPWTDKTWNPVTGCSPVSPGCKHCYAARLAPRLKAMGQPKYADGFAVRVHPECLAEPLRWRKPRQVFVCSMADLFHEDVPFEFIKRVWLRMEEFDRHTYQVLTKRAGRAREFMAWLEHQDEIAHPHSWERPNVWGGVTAENQEWLEKRIGELLRTPWAVRFVSLEPLLGPVNLRRCTMHRLLDGNHLMLDALNGMAWNELSCIRDPHKARRGGGLDWVIVGCESGPGRRPCKPEWVRDIVGQCRSAGVPVFVKQLDLDGRVSKDMAEWPEDLRVREFPEVTT